MTSDSNYTNYQGLRLLLYPDQLGGCGYVLALQNMGSLDLWDVRLELEEVIGPGAFGLDDTYMRRKPHADRIEIPHVIAGANHRLRGGERATIAGANVEGARVYVTFSIRPDAERRYGQRVALDEEQ